MSSLAILRPFESRNYQLFFGGQCISLIGSWMTNTATAWLAYKLTGSPFWLGIIVFASQIPNFILAPLAGVFADRVDRFRLLFVTQVLSMLQSFALAFFAFTNVIDIKHLLVLGIFQGVVNAFDMPTRQALLIQFVKKKEYLPNAIAMNSTMVHLTRLLGPAVAGFVLAEFGAAICFGVDGISFLAVLGCLAAMKLEPQKHYGNHKHPLAELREGFRYAFGFAPIRSIIVMITIIAMSGFPLAVLAPVFAKEVFHGDARVLGVIMGGGGLGAFCGALYLGMRKEIRGIRYVIVAGGVILSVGLCGLAFTEWMPLALVWIAMIGAGNVLVMASSNTVLQHLSDDDKRGRIMSLFTMAFIGMIPLGGLAIGAMANHIGPQYTVLVCAAVCLATMIYFYRQTPAIVAISRAHFAKKREEEIRAQSLAGPMG